jgi:hypothetical protein
MRAARGQLFRGRCAASAGRDGSGGTGAQQLQLDLLYTTGREPSSKEVVKRQQRGEGKQAQQLQLGMVCNHPGSADLTVQEAPEIVHRPADPPAASCAMGPPRVPQFRLICLHGM